jgi:archaellum component FlaD/FlaE
MILVDFAPVLPDLFSLGLVGVGLVSWLGDDGAEEVDQDGGEFDDEFEMEDDEFGDFDDDLDGLDGMEEGNGASSTELENRIEDLENEVANVSSTANTVRSENEQISEQVEDVEENVRKLLEIYEMVTRGVNPFVDDVSPEAGMGGGGSDFGLFGDEDGGEEDPADEDLESDIADAEAEEFFDDGAFDEEFEEGEDVVDDFEDEEFAAEFDEEGEEFGDDEADAFDDDEEFGEDLDDALDADDGGDLDDLGEFDDDLDEEFGDDLDEEFNDSLDEDVTADDATDGAGDSGDSGGGTSFEELKAEYESGEADWAEEESLAAEDAAEDDLAGTDVPAEDASATEAGASEEADESPELFRQDDLTGEDAVEADGDQSGDPETDAEGSTDAEPEDLTATETGAADPATAEEQTQDFQFGAATATGGDGGPHLESPPSGYLADVVLLEWLSDLLAEFGPRNAMRAVNHYERIGWIGEPMADHCFAMLQGLTESHQVFRDETGPTDLSMADHRRSLRYVEELAAGRLDRELGERLSGTDGVQR